MPEHARCFVAASFPRIPIIYPHIAASRQKNGISNFEQMAVLS
jgi:hypothetical protein